MAFTYLSSIIRVLVPLSLLATGACNDELGTQGPVPPPPPPNPQVQLRVLETADIHVHLMDHDYYRDRQDVTLGLARTASLIREARTEVANSVLVDNGDLIQGNPLGDFIAQDGPLAPGEVHPVYQAMNLLDYDVANIGNHEFNYGLPFLDQSLAGAEFSYISANVFRDDDDGDDTNDLPYFDPYVIQQKIVTDSEGNQHELKIGFIGFVPPQIMNWDRTNLTGHVIAKDIVAMAMHYVPDMRSEGADVVIAIPHSGLNVSPAQGMDENASYYLSMVPGIDAIMFGHSHRVFPGPDYDGLEGVDIARGTVNGVPAVMPGYWGSHLGVVDLTLELVAGTWKVRDSQAEARPVSMRVDGETMALVEPDLGVVTAVMEEHVSTVAWLSTPIGDSTAAINSFFAMVQDDPSVELVNDAQRWYVQDRIATSYPELMGLPVLSAAAPFKAGFGSPSNYTDIAAGPITLRNMADLYIYPNTLYAVRLTGAQVREWLERSAGAFNQIDPASTEVQPLLDSRFPTYNFDVIDGVTYQIDVTQPARYDSSGMLTDPEAPHRIIDLRYNGELIAEDADFVVATNNYRATGGGKFPNLTQDTIVIEGPDENRQIIVDYIRSVMTVDPAADGNWSIAPINATVDVSFKTSPSATTAAAGNPRLIDTGVVDDDGYAVYRLVLDPGL